MLELGVHTNFGTIFIYTQCKQELSYMRTMYKRKIAFAKMNLFLDMLFEVNYETAKTAQPIEVIGTNDHVRQWDDINTLVPRDA